MTGNGNNEHREVTLAAHQQGLVEAVLAPSSARVILLDAGPGLGKTTALVEVAARMLRERPAARVLVLTPAGALRNQFVMRLEDAGVPVMALDRYRLRELLDVHEGTVVWPEGTVVVATLPFVRQADVGSEVTQCNWDLMIVDEAHFAFSTGSRAVRDAISRAAKVLLATATPERILSAFAPVEVEAIRWHRSEIAASLGAPDADVRVQSVLYDLDEGEIDLARAVRDLRNALAHGVQSRFVSQVLAGTLQSSPAALEASVRRLVERRRQLTDEAHELELDDDELDKGALGEREELIPVGPALEALNELVVKLEAVVSDSKLRAFRNLLRDLDIDPGTSRRVCVATTRVATAFYLSAELESLGIPHRLLHGGQGSDDRESALSDFGRLGGVLLTTMVLPSDDALRSVTDLMLYDLPPDAAAVDRFLGNFNPLGRTEPLAIYVFAPGNAPFEEASYPASSLSRVFAAATA